MARWKKRLTDGPESSGTGERGESGVRTLLGRKVGWAYMPKGRRGAGRWGERQGERPGLAGCQPREGEKASGPNTRRRVFFPFPFSFISRYFQIILKAFEIILNFGQNHSSQKLQCSSMYVQACN